MTTHRVGRLDLNVVAPGTDPAVAGRAEAFVRAVLECAGDRLEARAPGRRVFVRRLPLAWSIALGRLGDEATIERLAALLADDLEALASEPEGLSPAPGDVVAFVDEAHWRAAHLHALARGGGDSWVFARLGGRDEALAALAPAGRAALALAVLERLARHGALLDVLAALPEAPLAALEAALAGAPSARGPGPVPSPVPLAHLDELLAELAASRPARLGARALALALAVHARAATGGAHDGAALAAAVARALAGIDGRGPAAAPGASARAPRLPATRDMDRWHSEHAGLFFLLNPLVELAVGEALYAACLPEGLVVAHALAALLGEGGAQDPAPWLAGGVLDAPRALPDVAPADQATIACDVLTALVSALPRRGLAGWPAVELLLSGAGAMRLLVARAHASPFVLFAWPAPTPAAAAAGVARFLSLWPASAPPVSASPALAELDRGARLHPARPSGPSVLVPDGASAEVAALLAQLAGAAAYLFAARVEAEPVASPASFVAAYLRASGDVWHEGADELRVRLRAGDSQLAVRRAGLDRDPGHIAWLGRQVRFELVGDEELG